MWALRRSRRYHSYEHTRKIQYAIEGGHVYTSIVIPYGVRTDAATRALDQIGAERRAVRGGRRSIAVKIADQNPCLLSVGPYGKRGGVGVRWLTQEERAFCAIAGGRPKYLSGVR